MGAALPFSINDLPGVWRGGAWAQVPPRVVDTGHGLLNAQLPGGGWPLAGMTELLSPAHAHCEWRLLAPALPFPLSPTSTPRFTLPSVTVSSIFIWVVVKPLFPIGPLTPAD